MTFKIFASNFAKKNNLVNDDCGCCWKNDFQMTMCGDHGGHDCGQNHQHCEKIDRILLADF